jgi:hypothetical protein
MRKIMSNNLIIVPISDEPTYGFKRTATMAALHIGALPFIGENVNLICQVDYFEPTTDAPITLIPPKIVQLIADNTTCVDANGVIVPCGSPEAVMTELEFYLQMLNVPVVIADMVEQKILWADSQGRFN